MADMLINIGAFIVFLVLLLGASIVLRDAYLSKRKRWFESRSRSTGSQENGIDSTGELTTGAKYALWSYMFWLLGIGGTIVALISGTVGYMINDVAKEKATQAALSEMQKATSSAFSEMQKATNTAFIDMQKSVLARLAELENAKVQLAYAARDVATESVPWDQPARPA